MVSKNSEIFCLIKKATKFKNEEVNIYFSYYANWLNIKNADTYIQFNVSWWNRVFLLNA